MGARGRKSSADLAVIGASGIEAVERPKPVDDLSPEQAAEWRRLVNAHAADRFPCETWPMLAAHCRHTVAQRKVGQLIEAVESQESVDVSEYDRLLKMQERESRCLASLAVRLGFAYSTAYEKRPEKGKGKHRPWES